MARLTVPHPFVPWKGDTIHTVFLLKPVNRIVNYSTSAAFPPFWIGESMIRPPCSQYFGYSPFTPFLLIFCHKTSLHLRFGLPSSRCPITSIFRVLIVTPRNRIGTIVGLFVLSTLGVKRIITIDFLDILTILYFLDLL